MPSRRPAQRAPAAAPTRADELRRSDVWAQLSRRFLARNPLCYLCEQVGQTTIATQVHHIQPAQRVPELAYEWSNLAPICNSCHATINSLERDGEHLIALQPFDDYEPRPEHDW